MSPGLVATIAALMFAILHSWHLALPSPVGIMPERPGAAPVAVARSQPADLFDR